MSRYYLGSPFDDSTGLDTTPIQPPPTPGGGQWSTVVSQFSTQPRGGGIPTWLPPTYGGGPVQPPSVPPPVPPPVTPPRPPPAPPSRVRPTYRFDIVTKLSPNSVDTAIILQQDTLKNQLGQGKQVEAEQTMALLRDLYARKEELKSGYNTEEVSNVLDVERKAVSDVVSIAPQQAQVVMPKKLGKREYTWEEKLKAFVVVTLVDSALENLGDNVKDALETAVSKAIRSVTPNLPNLEEISDKASPVLGNQKHTFDDRIYNEMLNDVQSGKSFSRRVELEYDKAKRFLRSAYALPALKNNIGLAAGILPGFFNLLGLIPSLKNTLQSKINELAVFQAGAIGLFNRAEQTKDPVDKLNATKEAIAFQNASKSALSSIATGLNAAKGDVAAVTKIVTSTVSDWRSSPGAKIEDKDIKVNRLKQELKDLQAHDPGDTSGLIDLQKQLLAATKNQKQQQVVASGGSRPMGYYY